MFLPLYPLPRGMGPSWARPEPASALPGLEWNPCLPTREGLLHLINLVLWKVLCVFCLYFERKGILRKRTRQAPHLQMKILFSMVCSALCLDPASEGVSGATEQRL